MKCDSSWWLGCALRFGWVQSRSQGQESPSKRSLNSRQVYLLGRAVLEVLCVGGNEVWSVPTHWGSKEDLQSINYPSEECDQSHLRHNITVLLFTVVPVSCVFKMCVSLDSPLSFCSQGGGIPPVYSPCALLQLPADLHVSLCFFLSKQNPQTN